MELYTRANLDARAFPKFLLPAGMLLINLAVVLNTVHVLHTPVSNGAVKLLHVVLWMAALNVVSSILVLSLCGGLVSIGRFRIIQAADLLVSLVPFPLIIYSELSANLEVFGLIYATFIFLKLGVLVTCLALVLRQRDFAPWRWIFVIGLTVYVSTTPWVTTASWPTGDEPHYLLLAHSLVYDHDFDVSNNYSSKDYRIFYPPDLEPHTVTSSRGEKMLWHDIGTSVLLAPGYWAAGRTGAVIEVNIAAALLALAIFVLARQFGATWPAALACWLLCAFSSPLMYYSSLVYPEVLGASCSAWAAVAFIEYAKTRRILLLVGAGALVALLPWLSIRFWVPAGALESVIAAYLLLTRREKAGVESMKAMAAAGLPLIISVSLFSLFDYRHFGTILPNAAYLAIRESYPQFWTKPHISLVGMLLDRGYGLLPLAPVYILALAGILRYAKRRLETATVLAPALAYLGFMSFSSYWPGGWCPPGRYILLSAALLAPFSASLVTASGIRFLVIVFGLWSLLVAFVYTALPSVQYPSTPILFPGGLSNFVGGHLGIEPGLIFPSIMRGEVTDYGVAIVWIMIGATFVWWVNRKPLAAATAQVHDPLEHSRREVLSPHYFGYRSTRLKRVVAFLVVLVCIPLGIAIRRRSNNDSDLFPMRDQLDKPLAAFQQNLTTTASSLRLAPGQDVTIPVRIENPGPGTWASAGHLPVTISYKWFDGQNMLPIEGERTLLPAAIKPNEAVDVNVRVVAPNQIGHFTLRITLVQEGVSWFMSKGGKSLPVAASVSYSKEDSLHPDITPAIH
jgi:hypothetical protein